jgi:3-methyladenine DNA glycosylase AlkD
VVTKGPDQRTPRRAAAEVIAELRRRADPKKAASSQRYFKEPVAFYGLDAPTAKAMIKDLVARARRSWTLREAVSFCNVMVRDPHLEPRGIGFQVVAAFVADAGPDLLPQVRRWLEKSCGNWALVDNLAPSVLAPLVERHPEVIPEVMAWAGSSNMWLRRGAVVTFVPLARHGKHLDAAYAVASRLFDDREDLMHKAVGWMLREAGKTDMARLERFLRAEGSTMPRTTVRYAIERFPKGTRARLLEATRPASA